MLDKELIKKNFKKSILTYDENAYIQKITANSMINKIKGQYFENILEVGSFSGILTRYANKNLNYKNYFALDIVEDSKEAVRKIDENIEFINCDIEEFVTDKKFDLILSNASLQWCNNLNQVIKKLKSYLQKEGKLVVSIFQKGNLSEIKDIFDVELNYPSIETIKNMFSKNAIIVANTYTLQFDNALDVLKHLKQTGVNSIRKNNLSIIEIKTKLKILENKYDNKITYRPVIIID